MGGFVSPPRGRRLHGGTVIDAPTLNSLRAANMTAVDVWCEIHSLRPTPGTICEPTETPGVFYHGSQFSDIAEFEPQFDERLGFRREVYFTHIPTYAAVAYATSERRFAAARNSRGAEPRIYAVELVTSNVITMPPRWKHDMLDTIEGGRDREALAYRDLGLQGYDCVISEQIDGLICELAIFDKTAVRYHSAMGPVADAAEAARASGMFYAVDHLPDPEYAPGCGLLFGSREMADAESGDGFGVRPVKADLHTPIYCERDTWPLMNLDVLRRFRIDALIDPATGDVLTLDRRHGQLNRAMRRALRRKEARCPRLRKQSR